MVRGVRARSASISILYLILSNTGTLSDFVVLMAQYRFDTVMIHVVLPLLRHRSSRETHAISNQLYFGLRVMCRIFEHVASTTTWKPACRRDDDDNVLSRAVRFVRACTLSV